MIPQELVDGLDLARLELSFKLPPIRLQDLKRREREDLLHKREHPRPQQEHALAPVLKLGVPVLRRWRLWCLAPEIWTRGTRARLPSPRCGLVFDPHG